MDRQRKLPHCFIPHVLGIIDYVSDEMGGRGTPEDKIGMSKSCSSQHLSLFCIFRSTCLVSIAPKMDTWLDRDLVYSRSASNEITKVVVQIVFSLCP